MLLSGKVFSMAHDDRPRDQSGTVKTKKVGLGLGYFSLALGAVEVAAPGRLARFLGLEGNKTAKNTIFAFGLRELAAGGMLLRGPAVSTDVWNRVIGDAMDAAALGLAMRSSTRKGAVAGALAFVCTAAVADFLTARALDKRTARTFPPPGKRTGKLASGAARHDFF
jgi:hypothetical protein